MENKLDSRNSSRVIIFLLGIITVFIFAAVIKITASVVLPFTIAVLLAFVTNPIAIFLEKFRMPRIVSALLILVLLFGFIFLMGMILYNSGQRLSALYPRYEERIRDFYILVALFFDLPYDEYISIFENIWRQAEVRLLAREMTLSFTNDLFSFMASAFMVSAFMVCLLFEASFFRRKLDKAFPGPRAERIKKISSDVISKVTNYLFIMFFISVLNGVLVGLSLWIIGVELAAVWGVIQFVLNFIPSIGSIVAGVGASAFALVQFWPEPGPIIATALAMIATNILCSFIILPKVMGDTLGLSPLTILVSLLVWGWLWGFTGLILAVPMMAIIRIVCENVPMLEPISIILGSRKAVMTDP